MGGPDGPDAVGPFLRNLFSDPMIFPAPKPFGPLLGQLIARLRTSGVRKRYLTISPDGRTLYVWSFEKWDHDHMLLPVYVATVESAPEE